MEKDELDDLELNGSITLGILDGIARNFTQARSQKFAMGGGLMWGSGGGAPALEIFAFFCKNSLILGLFY